MTDQTRKALEAERREVKRIRRLMRRKMRKAFANLEQSLDTICDTSMRRIDNALAELDDAMPHTDGNLCRWYHDELKPTIAQRQEGAGDIARRRAQDEIMDAERVLDDLGVTRGGYGQPMRLSSRISALAATKRRVSDIAAGDERTNAEMTPTDGNGRRPG